MTLEELKKQVRESPNYRDALARAKEAAVGGACSIAYPSAKLNKTMIDRLKEDGYSVNLIHETSMYIISGW